MTRRRLLAERGLLIGLGALLAAFLIAPLAALLLSTTAAGLQAGLWHPLVWPAVRLSLLTTSSSLLIVVLLGTPLAWSLASARGRVARAVEAVALLPIVVPPSVAGIGLLLAFGRRGVLAGWLYPEEWAVTFTTGAVVMAQVFVSAPFFLQAAVSAFRRVDPRLIVVARTFGASPLRVLLRVALPLAAPGLVGGAAMSWARSLGEFGATLMFAGNLEGKTQTLPLAIYAALETDMRAAQALSIALVVVSFALLLVMRGALERARGDPRGSES